MSTMQGGKLMVFGGGWQDIQSKLLMKIVSLLDDRTVIVASGVCSGWRKAILLSWVKREWQDILPELLMKILSFLDDRTVIVASGVCSGWRKAICNELTRFSLSWCTNNINNLVLSLLPKFTNLRNLDLSLTLDKKRVPLLDDNAVETIANNCHDLEDLHLSLNCELGDRSLYALARGCPNLTKLNIGFCSGFTDRGLVFLSIECKKLKILNLFGCHNAATNKALKAIGDNCRQLESINLGWCFEVGDDGVKDLAYGCPNLNAVDLFQCISVTDESVIPLANNCLHLRSLGLSHCHSITDKAMDALARGRVKSKDEVLGGSVKTQYEEEGLTYLNISYCNALTAPAVQALCDSFPALHTCPRRRSLIMNGCSNLTSVHCACDSQSHRASLPA